MKSMRVVIEQTVEAHGEESSRVVVVGRQRRRHGLNYRLVLQLLTRRRRYSIARIRIISRTRRLGQMIRIAL